MAKEIEHGPSSIQSPVFDTTGGKCGICHARATSIPSSCLFVNVDSRLAKEGVCERHRVTDETTVEYIAHGDQNRKQELERKYPGHTIYYSNSYDRANSKKPVPEIRI